MEKINTTTESISESIYESAEFKIIEEALYEQYAEEDSKSFRSMIDHYLKAKESCDEKSLETEVYYIHNFIQSNTLLEQDAKDVAYNTLITKLNT